MQHGVYTHMHAKIIQSTLLTSDISLVEPAHIGQRADGKHAGAQQHIKLYFFAPAVVGGRPLDFSFSASRIASSKKAYQHIEETRRVELTH